MIQHTIAAALICANLAAPMAVDSQPMPAMQVESLGTFEVTAYAEDEITKTGTVPRPMKAVAVDPDVIPLGSELYIADLDLYVIAEDIGGAVQGTGTQRLAFSVFVPSINTQPFEYMDSRCEEGVIP